MKPQVKVVFEYLIDQEKEHLRTFAKMKEGLENSQLFESYPGEMQSYIIGFVEGSVFSKSQGA